MSRKISLHIGLIAVALMLSCQSYSNLSEKRAEKAAGGSGDIVIGIADSSSNPSLFLDGIALAVEDINREGGIAGRKIKTVIYDDKGDFAEGQNVARSLAKNPDVVAVIGHRLSDVAIPASIIYEQSGILFISHGATHPNLTRYGGSFTFRNIPTDEEIGRQIAQSSHKMGGRKGSVFYERKDNFQRLADVYKSEADNLKIATLGTHSFFKWQTEFRDMLSVVRKDSPEGIFIAGSLPVSAILIKQARDMEITVPVIGGTDLDSPELVTIAGRAAEGTIVATVFNSETQDRGTMEFVRRFRTKSGVVPDTWAAQGYDALSVLAAAMKKANSSVPVVVASALRFMDGWHGVTGAYSFTREGDTKGKAIYLKRVKDGKFELMRLEKADQAINPMYVVEDRTLRIPIEGAIQTIDPGLTEDMASIEVTAQLFLALTNFDPKTYQPVPGLATGWTVSEDGTTYRFRLRQDAKWTDGSPVTAHDIVWAIHRNLNPDTKCPYANVLYILKNAQAVNKGKIKDYSQIGVRAADDFTVEFILEYAATYFPALTGLWVYRPLHKQAIETYGEKWTDPANIQVNGAYKPVYWNKAQVMILRKNPKYYDHKSVRIEEIRYYNIPQSSVGLEMYRNNELDIMGGSYLKLPFAEIPNIKADPKSRGEYSQQPHFAIYAYGFDVRRPVVNNVLVRKAISAAINRELIVDLILKGGAKPATTFTPPAVFGGVDPKDGVGIRFNPDQARKWLSKAGYPGGKGFPEITLWHPASENHERIAQAVQASVSHYLNISIKLEAKEFNEFLKATSLPDNPADMFQYGWFADYPDANNFLSEQLHPLKSGNRIGWNNKEFADLMNKAEKSSNPVERKSLYKRGEKILCEEEAAMVPIYFETAHCLVKPRVKNWYQMAIGGQRICDWYFEK